MLMVVIEGMFIVYLLEFNYSSGHLIIVQKIQRKIIIQFNFLFVMPDVLPHIMLKGLDMDYLNHHQPVPVI